MPRTAKILIVGRSGQVAQSLTAAVWPAFVAVEARGRESVDLRDDDSVADAIKPESWSLVINAAAFTQVDRAESEPHEAFAVNRDGPRRLAAACAHARIPLIHLSTDYVFDGEKSEPYSEDDATNPISIYGKSKCEGETAIRAGVAAHVILRTSWVFSATGQNFVKTMLRLGGERAELRIVNDQRGCPTPAQDIAETIVRIATELLKGKTDGFGTFHFAGAGPTTWHGFAEAIFRMAAMRGYAPQPRLTPISTAEYPTPARRPMNSVLATSRISRVYDAAPRPWASGLANALDVLLGPDGARRDPGASP